MLGRSLVELEEDRKLVVAGYLLEMRLDARLITSLGHAGQLPQIDHPEQAFQDRRNFRERLFGPDRDELAREFGFRHLRLHYGYSIGSSIKAYQMRWSLMCFGLGEVVVDGSEPGERQAGDDMAGGKDLEDR